MTLRLSALCALLLAFPSTAAAQTGPSLPEFTASAEPDRVNQATYISADGDGCYEEPSYEGDIDGYSVEDYESCITLTLKLTRNGRPVPHADRGFYEPVDYDDPDYSETGAAGKFIDWSCKRTGRYRWRVTYTNDSVPGYSVKQPYTRAEHGSYRVPKCGRPKPRRVSRGVAVQHAAEDNQAAYETEFISSARCDAASPLVNGRASTWICNTTHNNTYRECVDRDTMQFFTRRQFGRTKKSYRTSTTKHCATF
jgi:hypothetical protein